MLYIALYSGSLIVHLLSLVYNAFFMRLYASIVFSIVVRFCSMHVGGKVLEVYFAHGVSESNCCKKIL